MKIDSKKLKHMINHPPKGRFLSIKEICSFGLYATSNNTMFAAMGYVVSITYIPYFYNISAMHGYLIVIAGNFLNMLLQPIIGNLMERTNTKWGRYKPYILFGAPLFGIFTLLATYIPQFDIETSRIIYAYFTCVPVIAISTFCNNMYQTMPNNITPNSQERADVMTPIGIMVGIGPVIMQLIAGPVRSYFLAQGNEYMGLRIIGMVAVAIGICGIAFIINVKERVYALDLNKEKIGIKESLSLIRKNKPLLILLLALVVGSLREFWRLFMSLMIQFRFAETMTASLNMSGIVLSVIGFSNTIGMLLLPIFTRKMNKHNIIMTFGILNIIAMCTLGLVGFENIAIGTPSIIIVTALLFIAGINPTTLVVILLVGDLADYQQLKTGRRMEGYIQNFVLTIPLLMSQVFMLAASVLQTEIGFEPSDYSGIEILSAAQQAISNQWFNIVCLISAGSSALMILILFFYPLTKKKHEKVLEELKERSIVDSWGEGEQEKVVLAEGVMAEETLPEETLPEDTLPEDTTSETDF